MRKTRVPRHDPLKPRQRLSNELKVSGTSKKAHLGSHHLVIDQDPTEWVASRRHRAHDDDRGVEGNRTGGSLTAKKNLNLSKAKAPHAIQRWGGGTCTDRESGGTDGMNAELTGSRLALGESLPHHQRCSSPLDDDETWCG